MRRVFNAELIGKGGLYAYLDLPASTYQLLDMLERLNMKPGDLLECEICKYHSFEFLAPFLKDQSDLYEINGLSHALAGLQDWELPAFEGLLQVEINKRNGDIGIDKLFALASSTDCCHVVDDVHNDAQLGRFYAENGFIPAVEKVPDEIFELLDFELLGRKARMGEGGVFTRGGYVVPHGDIRQTLHTPPQTPKKPDYIFRLVLNNYPFENEENHVWHNVPLELPAAESELDAALEKLGNPPWSGVVIGVEDSAIPGLLDDADCFDGMEQINRLAMTIRQMDEAGQLTKYKAVLQATGCTDLDTAEALAGRLDEYILDPSSRTLLDVAWGEIRAVMDERTADVMLSHLDLYSYGRDLIKCHNSEITPYGLVERRDGQPLQTEQPSQGGMEMM